LCEEAILKTIENDGKYFENTKEKINSFENSYLKLLEKINKNEIKRDNSEIQINTNENIYIYLLTGKNPLKPYLVSKNRLRKLYPKKDEIKKTVEDIKRIIGGCNYTLYKFILDELEEKTEESFETNYSDKNIQKELLKEFFKKTREEEKEFFKNSKPYYLIIDEINRGNISKIFGELITLLEKDKRLGKKDELTTQLPYSKEEFGIPPNLFIIGTMNTSDKSIANLDIALRRRFGFIEMLPKYDLNTNLISEEYSKILKTLNKRIEILLDKDHLIGHSFFMKENGEDKDLEFIFKYEIVPLLEEYFYNDYEKIQ
jgi:5-methylcytosine-specific restriction protein B